MVIKSKVILRLAVTLSLLYSSLASIAQRTQIRGFVDVLSSLQNGKVSFGFGEQDLFITSELNDRISFLGETVFKYTPNTPTEFSVSVERVVIKYNYAGNHNLLVGKHHTPLNYWNDTYHHGRVFFPTIDRPLLFAANIIPLHTVGIDLQGHDLGGVKFGYDLMVGNGLGSEEVADNDKYKSVTAAIHIKPWDKVRLGLSYYYDVISKGADVHGRIINYQVNQSLIGGSIAYFGPKFEFLAESTLGYDQTDTTGTQRTFAGYVYAGYKIAEKFIPYVRYDHLEYQDGEIYFLRNNTNSIVAGFRFQINYLAVVKLEYQHLHAQIEGNVDKFTAQFAIGF
jgi:hypothetical protein